MESRTFLLFRHLPREIRDRIWYLAMPHASEDTPAIFFHENRFLRPWQASPGDIAYHADYSNWYSRYFYEELDPVPVVMPLVYVNREAREAACFYAKELGYEVVRSQGEESRGAPIFARGMDRLKDILYFEPGGLEAMLINSFDELVQLNELHDQYLNPTQYGICARGCTSDYLEEILQYPGDCDAIYLFIPDDGAEEMKSEANTGNVSRRRVEAASFGGRTWAFNNQTRQWKWTSEQHGEMPWSEELNKAIEGCVADMVDMKGWASANAEKAPTFFIQPVKAKIVNV